MKKLTLLVVLCLAASASWAQTIKIGLVTALSGQSARAGEAITRGLTIAIDEINAGGGVLGRKLELVRRDDEATPAKGVIAARELLFRERVAVLFGGLDTPVSLAIVPIVNEQKVPFMGPWAAGTPITKNGAKDNYVFRVSAVDDSAVGQPARSAAADGASSAASNATNATTTATRGISKPICGKQSVKQPVQLAV